MKYNKLVRDRIPEIIEKSGKTAVTRTLDDDEYEYFLKRKLDEEVAEFHKSKSIEELADISEVLDALCVALGFSLENLITIRQIKRQKRGGFSNKTFLVETIEEGEE